MDWIMLLNSFWVGGLLCAVAQVLIDKTNLTPARIMTGYVVAGVILTGAGIYEHVVSFAGSGATVPIIGFGYTLAKGVEKAVRENGLLGAFCGGVTSAACGISVAIFFGLLFSVIFKPKSKK